MKSRAVHESREINNYRELLNYSVENYADNIAYKYKVNPTDKIIIEKNIKKLEKMLKHFQQHY